jgi:hypothetical protein
LPYFEHVALVNSKQYEEAAAATTTRAKQQKKRFVLIFKHSFMYHNFTYYLELAKWQVPGSLALTVSALDGNRGHWDQLLENLDGVTNTQVRLI